MATTSNTYTGNGSNKLFSITFPYLETTDVDVYLNGTLQTITTQYTFANATTIEFVAAPGNGAVVLLDRSTDDATLQATFFPGSSIKAADLNADFDQVLYIAQETNNVGNAAVTVANTALAQSTTAISTANAATTTANNAVTTANNAVTTANNAVTTANNASTTANGIAATANTALSNSNTAVSTSNTALSTANTAKNTADQAIILADEAITLSNKSFGDLYTGTLGSPGSKVIDLGNLTSGCASDYFPGENGGTQSYTCALGCSAYSLGTV
jgi:hypothetical protein